LKRESRLAGPWETPKVLDDEDDLIARLKERAAADPPPDHDDAVRVAFGQRAITLPFLKLPPDPRPPRLPPCRPEDVDRLEERLGLTLPPLLRRMYVEVGDGGFGPGDGILGLDGLAREHRSYAVELAVEQELGEWPATLLPLCQLDDTLIACIDCSDPAGPIIGFEVDDIDFDEGEGFDEAFRPRSPALHQWLDDWLRTGAC
jgi:hypothetical protein